LSYVQLAQASVMGRSHISALGNNQDAYHTLVGKNLIVVVVCDGCSDGEHSEVGAWRGAHHLAHFIAHKVGEESFDPSSSKLWELAHQDLISEITQWATNVGGSFSNAIRNYFLFTTLVGVITPEETVFASVGDGVIVVNGTLVDLPTTEGNKPPYVALALTSAKDDYPPEDLRFKVQFSLPTPVLKHFLLGTDGVKELIASEGKLYPGKNRNVGHISQFWRNDYIFSNPDGLRRELDKLNKPITRVDWKNGEIHKFTGLLTDDTTMIVGRMTEV